MAQTATSLAPVLKERWTDDQLQQQFMHDDSILKRFQAYKATMIGKQAQTPVWNDLNSGGYTTVGAGGGAINTASNQVTSQAVWTLVQQAFPIALEFSALNQSDGNMLSVIAGKNLEIEGALKTLARQAVRQIVTNGDSIVAQCASGGASTTVSLVASPSGTAYGFDAIQRNWLRPGARVSVGTTANAQALAANTVVTAVSESASAPTITIGTSITTVAGTHFVFINNPNSATALNPELNGLRNVVASSGALGSLNPATAGQEFWQAAQRDTSTSIFSLDLMLSLSRSVKQKSGNPHAETWMGFKQQANFYSLLQSQVRFAGDGNLAAGKFDSVSWNGQSVTGFGDILDSDVWCLTPSDLLWITGQFQTPKWATDVFGANNPLQWSPGNTSGVDALLYAAQAGARRRNTQAGATALTA